MREWVPFLKEEVDEYYDLLKGRFNTEFSDELIYKLIGFLESSTIVEIDFNDLVECLEGCVNGYIILNSKEEFDHHRIRNKTKSKSIFANFTYSINGSKNFSSHFLSWADEIKSTISDEGFMLVSCSLTDDESSEFYMLSHTNQHESTINIKGKN